MDSIYVPKHGVAIVIGDFAACDLLSYIRSMHRITINDIIARFEALDALPRNSLAIPGYAHAAVLIPLIPADDSFDLLFTKRTESVETHKGQISFPGGMADATDSNSIETALRETQEEIGLSHSSITVVGMLDDLATPTRFIITPVVGVVSDLPVLSVNSGEVADVFRVRLDFFAQRQSGRAELRTFGGREHEVWYYTWNERVIWGATAMMIRSLLKKLGLI